MGDDNLYGLFVDLFKQYPVTWDGNFNGHASIYADALAAFPAEVLRRAIVNVPKGDGNLPPSVANIRCWAELAMEDFPSRKSDVDVGPMLRDYEWPAVGSVASAIDERARQMATSSPPIEGVRQLMVCMMALAAIAQRMGCTDMATFIDIAGSAIRCVHENPPPPKEAEDCAAQKKESA